MMTAIMTIPETLPTRKVLFPFPASLISSGASGFSSSTTGFGVSSLSSPSLVFGASTGISTIFLEHGPERQPLYGKLLSKYASSLLPSTSF